MIRRKHRSHPKDVFETEASIRCAQDASVLITLQDQCSMVAWWMNNLEIPFQPRSGRRVVTGKQGGLMSNQRREGHA